MLHCFSFSLLVYVPYLPVYKSTENWITCYAVFFGVCVIPLPFNH